MTYQNELLRKHDKYISSHGKLFDWVSRPEVLDYIRDNNTLEGQVFLTCMLKPERICKGSVEISFRMCDGTKTWLRLTKRMIENLKRYKKDPAKIPFYLVIPTEHLLEIKSYNPNPKKRTVGPEEQKPFLVDDDFSGSIVRSRRTRTWMETHAEVGADGVYRHQYNELGFDVKHLKSPNVRPLMMKYAYRYQLLLQALLNNP